MGNNTSVCLSTRPSRVVLTSRESTARGLAADSHLDMQGGTPRPWYQYVAAPMVDQSDLAFRLTTVQFGATATWTQMYHAHDVLMNLDLYERARRALELGRSAPENHDIMTGERAPQIVQLAGDDPDQMVRAARQFLPVADGIDVNLGCPQTRAQRGHYGGYLLGRRDWPLVEQIIQALSQACPVPISTKIRLCDTATNTYELGQRLAHAGSSLITLHARHVAPNRRRAGAAKLEHVRALVEALHDQGLHASQPSGRTRVLSNGNVRTWQDIPANLAYTQADGVMVGEPLLVHPNLFAPHRGPAMSMYLDMCLRYPDDTSMPWIRQHMQYMLRGLTPSRETRALQDALIAAPDVRAIQSLMPSASSASLLPGAHDVHTDAVGSSGCSL